MNNRDTIFKISVSNGGLSLPRRFEQDRWHSGIDARNASATAGRVGRNAAVQTVALYFGSVGRSASAHTSGQLAKVIQPLSRLSGRAARCVEARRALGTQTQCATPCLAARLVPRLPWDISQKAGDIPRELGYPTGPQSVMGGHLRPHCLVAAHNRLVYMYMCMYMCTCTCTCTCTCECTC